ncbi:hypothetical protein AF332_11380 [Sporosarcina globispora]|uniref:Uncharacterized protein n=1 Tax=Sporosarcina globispora TaxID=1459 RepID=A0A0M0GBR9_SPOGL|nr:helix-turn-helix domain-containing protein [Sporosarcina globispora]KON87365.1 hypothetical protein AF332_11380 [Sporosarcina globispora]
MNDFRKYLQVNEYQNKIYIPNEIFNDLRVLHNKGSSHVAFTYSYYYLISWLYRYAKYGELNIDVKMIKQLLGYSPENKKVNYLIKKNGFLDEIGYTCTDTDYPLSWNFNGGDINFMMLSDMDEDVRNLLIKQKGKNYKVKVPVKGLWRTVDSEKENVWDGTFYDIEYTHELNFDVFVKCIENDQLGVSGFYLYGYLKYRCDKFNEYHASIERISEEVGMSKNTADKYLTKLCLSGLLKYKENDCVKVEGEYKKQANSYSIA